MRILHYLKIVNFKRFGKQQEIQLDHPTVITGPNNCGKTTAIQAISLWSQAVKTWYQSKGEAPPPKRTSTSLNRLSLASVPVQRTRYLWNNTNVRRGNHDIHMVITLGLEIDNQVCPVTMRFRNQGEDLIYCTPDEDTLSHLERIKTAAELNVRLLHPMSGLETEEPILQPGRIDVLLGQGQTAQVLRNLCLLVHQESTSNWKRLISLMERLFNIRLGTPEETSRGSVNLFYRQDGVREGLDIALAGRGVQQMLLVFTYLYSHPHSVVMFDEPDAHMEILRQKQVYVLLREIASSNGSQVILATHSEVLLDEAVDRNLTLLLGGRAYNMSAKKDIRDALKHYGTAHYVNARQHGHVLYVEGSTDIDNLRELAVLLGHPVAERLTEPVNVFYVRNNFPDKSVESELVRVEGGFGITPEMHFFGLRQMVPDLRGLAILDSDSKTHQDQDTGGLRITHWQRYECENYFVTPDVLLKYAMHHYAYAPLFKKFERDISTALESLIVEQVFEHRKIDFATWKAASSDAARLLWEAKTKSVKLSDFAEEFFRRLAARLGHRMLLRKSELHLLVPFCSAESIADEVREKLDSLAELLNSPAPD